MVRNIGLIAIDMDDTLVERTGLPGEEAVDAIRKAVSIGVRVTIATGRMFRSTLPCARALGLDIPLISYNGGLIRESISGETLFHKPVEWDMTRRIIGYCEDNGLSLNLYPDDGLKVARYNAHVGFYEDLVQVRADVVGDLSEYFDEAVKGRDADTGWGSTKLLIVADPPKADEVCRDLTRRYGDVLSITRSNPRFVEMMAPGVSKASALKRLAEGWGIGQASVMAIGDSLNDLEMVGYAGIGIAVANATEALKAKADYVTESPGGRGVSEAIRKFVLSVDR